MLPITLKLKHNVDKNNNVEIAVYPNMYTIVEYVKMYKKDKLTILHVSSKHDNETVEKSIYVCSNMNTELITANKVFTRIFDTDDYHLVHKVSKDLSTIAITAITKSTSNIRVVTNNKISLIKLENDIWKYCNDIKLPTEIKYRKRYRLSRIMSFDKTGKYIGVLLSAKDKLIKKSRRGCGVLFENINNRYVYKGYFKYKTTSKVHDESLLDVRSDKDDNSLEVRIVGNRDRLYTLITY